MREMERYRKRRSAARQVQPKINEPYEKKVVKQLIFSVILVTVLLLSKGIPVSGGFAGDYAKKVINHTTDVNQTAKDIMSYAEQNGLLPEWALKKGEQPNQPQEGVAPSVQPSAPVSTPNA